MDIQGFRPTATTCLGREPRICFVTVWETWHLKVVVHCLKVLQQRNRSSEAVSKVFDSEGGEVPVETLHQLLGHQPHVLKALALDPVTLCRESTHTEQRYQPSVSRTCN